MNLYICPNTHRENQTELAKACIASLENDCKVKCFYSTNTAHSLGLPAHKASESPVACDMIVAIGGDGAVLRAARLAVAFGKPLVGINGGTLGYLCAVKAKDVIEKGFSAFSDLTLQNRALLSAFHGDVEYYALNDVVISKSYLGRTTELDVSVGGSKLVTWRCDGIIVSTATGSTAYNLSAGGPVVMPNVGAFVITPICSHSLISRPIVVSDNEIVTVSSTQRPDNPVNISVDGVSLESLLQSVTVKKSPKVLELYSSTSGLSDTLYKISQG